MKKLFAIAFMITLLGTSCKKDLLDRYEDSKVADKHTAATSTSELKVDQKFDWKTTQEVNLNLTGYANSQVMIITPSGEILEKSMLKTNELYKTTISVPTTQKNIFLLYMGQKISIDLTSENISYQFN
ncbi:MAG: hypothetical protein Q8M15_02240 [Bacteroidota bacterium]|nr:hypothetical protein [Bacteroidota bacterium]